jgi:hypothetical protein
MGSSRYTVVVSILPFLMPENRLADLDFMTQAARLEVPPDNFTGQDDLKMKSSSVERDVILLQAPHKELIWLNGGHGLGAENLDQFVDVMVNHVLAQTQTAK